MTEVETAAARRMDRTPNVDSKKDPFKCIPDIIEERHRDADGEVVINRFMKGNILGKGGFAQVYCTSKMPTKDKYALKIVAKCSLVKTRAKQKLQTEIKIHRVLNHPNIVKFEYFFEDHNFAYMVLELCGNNSMSDLLNQRKRISEAEARFYLSQLVSSLQYLHRHLVIHRDLKLGNLFIDKDMRLKVGDFGLAAKLEHEHEKRMTVCGTPNYIAPELLEGKKGHSFEVDIWSTGVVLYTLLVGKPPFQSKDVKSTYKRIIANSYTYPDNIWVSNEAKNLITKLLQNKPESRASLSEILEDPFFTHSSVFTPTALPQSALKEIPILVAPSKVPSSMNTLQGKVASKVGENKFPIYGNENNPNAINQIPTKQEIRKTDAEEDRIAATRSISTRMKTALSHNHDTDRMRGGSTALPLREIKNASGMEYNNPPPKLSEREAVQPSSSIIPGRPRLTTTAHRQQQQVPKFDIFVDKSDDKVSNPAKVSVSHTSSSLNAPTLESATESSAAQTNHKYNAALGKLQEDLQEIHLQEETDKFLVGKRGEATGELHYRTPAEKYSRPKRVKEAWSADQQNPNKDNQFDNVKLDEDNDIQKSEPMAMSTPPEQIINADAVKNMRLGTLETMHDMLNDSISVIEKRSQAVRQLDYSKEPFAKIWVTRYVDYTSKYGLGFLFNNGSAGVYFNDSTKIVLSPDGKIFQYIERRRRDSSFGSEHSSQKHFIDSYPPELQKKVTLLKHFRNYLLDQEKNNAKDKVGGMEEYVTDTIAFKSAFAKDVNTYSTNAEKALGETLSIDDDYELPFLKKWVRTKHAILFRLSNRVVQVVFYDRSEVLLSSEARMITYVNKTGGRSEHALDDVMLAGRVDIAKRLKYTKDIMYRLINAQSK